MPLLIKTPTDFANALLGALGLPDTKNNVDNILGWWASEGGAGPEFGVAANDDSFNPLNTVLYLPGSVSTNSAGVKAYTSWQEGLDATVSELTQHGTSLGAGDFAPIYDDLAKNAPWSVFSTTGDWLNNISGNPEQTGGSVESSFYTGGEKSGAGSYSKYGDKTPVIPPGPSGPSSNPTGPAGPVGGSNAAQSKDAGPVKPKSYQGFAGVLQTLDSWFNPQAPGIVSSLTSLGGSDVKYIATLIFARTASSFVFISIAGIGVAMLVKGESGGGGGVSTGGGDVFEFIAQRGKEGQREATKQESRTYKETQAAQSHARRQGLQQTRISAQREQEAARNERNARRNAARELATREHRNARTYKARLSREKAAQKGKKKT